MKNINLTITNTGNEAAYRKAVKSALDYLKGTVGMSPAKVVEHGDPQLHTHILVAGLSEEGWIKLRSARKNFGMSTWINISAKAIAQFK